jgi:hypothetical protein
MSREPDAEARYDVGRFTDLAEQDVQRLTAILAE